MEKLGRLRRLFYRDGLTLSAIARKTGFARNTVRKWLKAAEATEPKYRRRKGQNKIAPFAALLDAHRIDRALATETLDREKRSP